MSWPPGPVFQSWKKKKEKEHSQTTIFLWHQMWHFPAKQTCQTIAREQIDMKGWEEAFLSQKKQTKHQQSQENFSTPRENTAAQRPQNAHTSSTCTNVYPTRVSAQTRTKKTRTNGLIICALWYTPPGQSNMSPANVPFVDFGFKKSNNLPVYFQI